MRNLIVITIAVLVLLANYTAWNSARSNTLEEIKSSDYYKDYTCTSVVGEHLVLNANEMSDKELFALYTAQSKLLEKLKVSIIEALRNKSHMIATAFVDRDVSYMSINERKETIANCLNSLKGE